MDQFIKVARVAEFPQKNYVCLSFLGKWIAVIRQNDGSFYAIEANCKHQNANLLSKGMPGEIVTCPRHGWKYNMRTGECLTEAWAGLRKHDVKIVDEVLYVATRPRDEDNADAGDLADDWGSI